MGAIIPTADQKLGEALIQTIFNRQKGLSSIKGAIDRHGGVKINTASDFIAQYTTRQEYKYADALPDSDRKQASREETSKVIPLSL